MRPRIAAGKALEELGGRNRAGQAARHVGHIGKIGLQVLAIDIIHRHAPAQVGAFIGSALQFVGQHIVGAEQAAAQMAQCQHAVAGQGGNIHHRLRLESLGIGQRIAQDQATLGIGVQDLDGLAAHALHHIARLERTAARHVLAGRNQAYHIDLGAQQAQRFEQAQHAGGTAHVELHLVHAGPRLERDATAVKGDALADKHQRTLAVIGAFVAQHDEARRFIRALGYGQERPHAELLDLLLLQHFAFKLAVASVLAGLGRDVACHFSQHARRGMVTRTVGPLPGKRHAGHQCLAVRQRALAGSRIGRAKQHLLQAAPGAGLGRAIDMAAGRNSRHGRRPLGVCGVLGKADSQLERIHRQLLDQLSQGIPDSGRRTVTDTQQLHPRRRARFGQVQRQALAGIGAPVAGCQSPLDQQGQSGLQRLSQVQAVSGQQDQDITQFGVLGQGIGRCKRKIHHNVGLS